MESIPEKMRIPGSKEPGWPGFLPPAGRKKGPKGPNLLADGFASIAFGYQNANFWADPNPWLPGWGKSITSKAARQKGKCDDE